MKEKSVVFIRGGIDRVSGGGQLKALSRFQGFTLSETLIAMAVAMISLLGFFAAAGQAVRIIHSGKQAASASQMLQQRIEAIRHTARWDSATTFDGIADIVDAATASAITFPSAAETFEVEPYPAGGTPLLIKRSANGELTCTGPDYANQSCVKFTASVTWTGYGNLQRTRRLSTILTKGGL